MYGPINYWTYPLSAEWHHLCCNARGQSYMSATGYLHCAHAWRRVCEHVWGSEEDVGEVLSLWAFLFSLPSRCRAVGFRATEGKINTEQTSPGTQAIPRGILGMWLRMSGLPLLPHPENCPWRPKIQRKTLCSGCVYTDEEVDWSMLSNVKLSNHNGLSAGVTEVTISYLVPASWTSRSVQTPPRWRRSRLSTAWPSTPQRVGGWSPSWTGCGQSRCNRQSPEHKGEGKSLMSCSTNGRYESAKCDKHD